MAFTYTNIENNESGLSARTKINAVGNEVSTLSTSVDNLTDNAYCCYTSEPSLALTVAEQKLTTFTEIITPVGISLNNGIFTTTKSGIYSWTLERVYTNGDTSPSNPIELTISIKKNGSVVYTRSAIIGSATGHSEPSIVSFNSPFIMSVDANDEFEFYFAATEGGSEPTSTVLSRMQLSANKIL